MIKEKLILNDILIAHCNAWENIKQGRVLAGISREVLFPKPTIREEEIDRLVNLVREEQVQENINKMPFPFI
ncbi:MAG: hypothetical protein MUF43_10475 [Flavobacterium sp.]|jgi:hypothetical protein|nr:hypothetical protein [Flavobacterium sp.]MCU0393571.1 hypothetical protein [Thermoflexibacter sp.]